MKEGLRRYGWFAMLPLLIITCQKEVEEENGKECTIDIDTLEFTFGIDYSDTTGFLIPGEQSDLSAAYLEEIRDAIGIPDNRIEDVLAVCKWVNHHFVFENGGGNMIGVNSVDELYEIKKFYGCHSEALIISSILREFGFPSIMIETADVQWGYRYHDGTVENFAGHVMSEIYVDGKWILLDNDGSYVEAYDPLNPFIPEPQSQSGGFFVFAKGKDTWDYNGKDQSFTFDQLTFFAEHIYCFEEMFYTITYIWQN